MKGYRTHVSGKGKEVVISREGPTTIIGEKINPTSRKDLTQALQMGNMEFIMEEVTSQLNAGADIIDLNVGAAGIKENVVLARVVEAVVSQVEVPICIDSNDVEALKLALEICPGKPLVNSVNGKEDSLKRILPFIAEKKAAVIGLTLDENGIPGDPEKRFAIAEKILTRAVNEGIPEEDVIIDPLVLTVATDPNSSLVTLETIRLVAERLGLNINLGLSNISFGLPGRSVINHSFLAMALAFGATCLITDAAKMREEVLASDMLLKRDRYCKRYLSFQRIKRSKAQA